MFSTHIMSDVEEMCERVALIADSRLLLFGDLAEIKRERGVRSIEVQAKGVPAELGTPIAGHAPAGLSSTPSTTAGPRSPYCGHISTPALRWNDMRCPCRR